MGGFENAGIIMLMLLGALAVAYGVQQFCRVVRWLLAIRQEERERDEAEEIDR